MKPRDFDLPDADVAWCPGCGNLSILRSLKATLAELEIQPENLVFVSGIGQAGKLPHYIKGNVFNGLHGRSLSPATAIKAANPDLTVIDVSGDGCMYGEGETTSCIPYAVIRTSPTWCTTTWSTASPRDRHHPPARGTSTHHYR
nr:thiamine pyrophosphate-dependent enzyme [Methanobacterium formicicum]